MRLWAIAERNVRQRFVTSALTVLSILMGTGLVAFLWMAADQAEERFRSSTRGFEAVLGPKDTSALEIVLGTIFHTNAGAGVIPISVYREFHGNSKLSRRVGLRYAIPYVFGDNYRNFPIIGTTNAWFREFSQAKRDDDERSPLAFAQGEAWDFGHEQLLAEADVQVAYLKQLEEDPRASMPAIPDSWRKIVLGADVAQRLGLAIGDRIVPTHGFEDSLHPHPEAESEVVGILERTGAPIDRAIYAPAGLMYRMSGHRAIAQGQELVPENVELSAVIVSMKAPAGPLWLRYEFRRRAEAQVAIPIFEINRLLDIVGNVTLALRAVSYLVLFTGALAIFISLYQTMFSRQRDVAVMRSLGARRSQIFGIVLIEALLLSFLGAVLGLLAAHTAASGFSDVLSEKTGVTLRGFLFSWRELVLLGGVCGLGALAGLLPALRTSTTDVARFLAPDR